MIASSENEEQQSDNKASCSPNKLLSKYERIKYIHVNNKVAELKQTAAEMHCMWAEEVKKYEQMIEIKFKGKLVQVPRRNYYNKRGQVDDPTMFPYHTACYPLLDCYDCLYEDREFQPTYEKHSVLPTRVQVRNRRDEPDEDDDPETHVPGQLQTSWQAIHTALLYEGEDYDETDLPNSAIGATEEQVYAMCKYSGNVRLDVNPELDALERSARAQQRKFELHGPHNLPQSKSERQLILLKLLRHAMSDLQKDHRLAYAVLRRMIDWCYFSDVAFYARFLAVIMVEPRKCDGECHSRFLNASRGEVEEPDHYCSDWQMFEMLLAKLVPLGVAHFTEDHALYTCAAVKMAFDTTNSGARSIEESLIRGGSKAQLFSRDPKNCLKQSLYLWKNTDEDDDSEDEDDGIFRTDPMPYTLMNEFLFGLGRRAVQSRDHISTLISTINDSTSQAVQGENNKETVASFIIDSFFNCLRTIVFCAEMSVRRLPSNQRSMEMGGVLVRCLVEAYLEPRVDALDDQEEYMPRWRTEELKGKTLIDFSRYSDIVINIGDSSPDNETPVTNIMCKANNFLKSKVPNDIRDAIRSLFARDLVDIYTSLCGFGDAVVWLRLPIHPLDPLIFSHRHNYVSNYDDSEPYLFDENSNELCASENKIAARYDFTLLLLQRSWNQHWTPERHGSFHKSYRDAAKNLLLASHRIGMPLEIARNVVEFLPRSWWPDKEATCWCQQCLVENSIQLMRWKLASEAETNIWTWKQPLVTIQCPECQISSWVSSEHRKRDYRAHLCDCGKPPFKKFDFEDELLCRDVSRATGREDLLLFTSEKTLLVAQEPNHSNTLASVDDNYQDEDNADGGADYDDDDGSWESVEEGDGAVLDHERNSATEIIFSYFNERFYKLRSNAD